jgi:hypothetical protein
VAELREIITAPEPNWTGRPLDDGKLDDLSWILDETREQP